MAMVARTVQQRMHWQRVRENNIRRRMDYFKKWNARKKWMDSHNLTLQSDLSASEEHSIYCLRTFHDPSVGIFGAEVTPWFDTEDELFTYVDDNRAKIALQVEE